MANKTTVYQFFVHAEEQENLLRQSFNLDKLIQFARKYIATWDRDRQEWLQENGPPPTHQWHNKYPKKCVALWADDLEQPWQGCHYIVKGEVHDEP